MNNIILTTKIPIRYIIDNVIKKEPCNECEFNNLLLFEISKYFFNNLEDQQKQILNKGGLKNKSKTRKYKTRKSKTRKSKTRKSKTRKYIYQKGGADPRIIMFFVSLFFIYSKAIKNMSDSDVINRIKEANDVSILFKNDYGTCSINTLLFLKTIDLPTFEQLSIDIIEDKIKFNRFKIASYLNKELHIYSKWYSITEKNDENNLRLGIDLKIHNYIDKIKNKLIDIRKFYNFPEKQSIITGMSFPFKNTLNLSHSVVIWLTSENELIIIDPQKFINNGLVFYSTKPNPLEKTILINEYIKENVDLQANTYIFESLHFEIEDENGENKLEKGNINLQNVISKIQETKDKSVIGKIEEL